MALQPSREPQPTLAYLMTDVVGSTRLWEKDREAMAERVARLEIVCRQAIEKANGQLLKDRGEGDSHFGVFGSVDGALAAASNILIALNTEADLEPIQVRAAIHAGTAESWAGDYYGPTVNRCARIRQAAQPGQILVSEAVRILAKKSLAISFKDLGVHRLRDLMQAERLFQVLHPDLKSDFAPPESLTALSHNLPTHLTSFIGREEEIRQLATVVRSNRLATVTGAGGVGKTRLALQVAAECLEDFKDGAWFIDLAQSERAESVLPILCSVLEPGIDATEERLLEAIEHRRMLLVFDNCEHLFNECHRLAGNMLLRCPNLRILATSRRALEVRGERVYKLGGLSLPDSEHVLEARQYDGFRLFVERAQQRGTGLVVNDSTIPGAVALCSKLDGLPLAIEMVASLTDVISIKEISRSIADYLEIPIDQGSGDPRQHTVASAIEWSRRLLSPEAQELLEDVAIFPNTWTLDAAREVCLPGSAPARARQLVKELVDHSLVFSMRTSRDDVRFGLLQTTREVVSKGSLAHRRLAAPYLSLCGRTIRAGRSFMESGEEGSAHELIDLEWETLMNGLEIAYEEQPGECVAMALALRRFWIRGSRMPEGRRWYEKLSACDRIDSSTKVSVQIALSGLYILLAEYGLAQRLLLAAEQAVQPIGGYDLARVIGNLAVLQDRMGRYEEAKRNFERCAVLFKDSGNPDDEALALLNLGVAKLRLEEPLAECEALFRQALEYAQTAGSASMQAKAYSSLAHIQMRQGLFKEALCNNESALTLWQEDPNIPDCALAMIDLVHIFRSVERFEEAAKAVHIAERLEELSQSPYPSWHRSRLDSFRDEVKPHLSAADWRSTQRQTRSKSAQELITLAIQMFED